MMATQEGRVRIERLYRECAAPLQGYLLRRLPTIEAVEDIAAEVWIRATKAIDGLRSPEAGKAWLFRIAYHAAADYYRRAGASSEMLEADAALLWARRPAESWEEPDKIFESKARLEEIMRLVVKWPVLHQNVFLLLASGYDYKDIGHHLHLAQPAVRVIVHRLRRRLAKEMAANP